MTEKGVNMNIKGDKNRELETFADIESRLLTIRVHKIKAVSNRWTGLLEWTTGMDYWNGL